MKHPSILSIAIILAIALAIPGSAQQSSMRLSSAEGMTRTLPVEMRVQSAARIGERTLVSWGTVEIDAAGVARNVLRVQLGRDGVPVDGTGMWLHSVSGRPSGVLHVAAAVDHFDVFWGDNRHDAPGLYARSFDLGGAPTSPERLLLPGEIEEILSYRSIGDMIVLRKDSSVVMLHPDGSVNPLALASTRYTSPHILRPDSSLIVLDGHRLDLYRRFVDAASSVSMELVLPDTLYSNAWTLSDVGDGAIAVTAVIRDVDPECRSGFSGDGVILRQIRLDERLAVTGSSDVDAIAECTFEERPFFVDEAARERIDGGFRIDVRFIQHPNVGRVHSFAVSACGEVERGPRATITCRPQEEVIARVSSDTTSAVSPSGAAVFTAPIEARDSGLPDARPNIVASSTGILVTWMRRVEPPEPFGTMSVHLARWSGQSREDLDVLSGNYGVFSIDGPDQSISYDDRANWFERPGATGVVRTEYVDLLFGDDQGSFKMDVATAGGWKRVDEASLVRARYGQPAVATNPNDETTILSIDAPEGQRGVVVAQDGSVVRTVRLAEGRPQHLVPVSSSEWIAAGVGASPTDLVRMNETTVLARVPRPSDGALEELWQRELGPTFIRASLAGNNRSLLVQRYDYDLAIIDSVRLPLADDARDISIVLNRADSSLGFLYVTGWDVRMATIARDLSVRSFDYLVYAGIDPVRHPAGAIDGGRLHAAWQDYRNGDADIYGLVANGPFTRVDAPERGVVPPHVTIVAMPLPAKGMVFIKVSGATSDARLTLVDVRGRVLVSRRLSGVSRESLDVSALAPGTYVARIVDRSGVVSCRVIVGP
jgi:hypothetical protein